MKFIYAGKGRVTRKETVVLLTILSMLVGCSYGPSVETLSIIEKEGGFEVAQGDAKILFYQCQAKSLDGKYTRSNYIHPLYGLDGEILTEDFPADHLHHRGIFWAWHVLKIGDKPVGDSWVTENFSYDVQGAKILNEDSQSSALQVEVLWKSPLWLDPAGKQKPFVKETTTVRVHNAVDDIRKIDFMISLTALEDEVYIAGASGQADYGGFSARIKMPDGLTFTGTKGDIEPKASSVEAAPWVDFTAPFQSAGPVSGVTILSHSSIPGYPRPWILRRKGSMQNAVFPGKTLFKLPKNKPLVLGYRLIIHRGNLSIEAIDRLQKQYNSTY